MNQMSVVVGEHETSVLSRVRKILPEIDARADEIERQTAVPLDLLDKLEEAGAFRIALPKMFGGEELSVAGVAQVMEEVAACDASTAWHLMVATGAQVISARLPLESLHKFYANGPDTFAKSVSAPKGLGTPVEGGYRVSGRWPLASGARRFDWIALGFVVKGENGVLQMPDGRPDIRTCLVPRGDAKIIETWDAVGLRGTRSDDIEVCDIFVAEAWQAQFFGPSSVNAPTLGMRMPVATAPHHTAVVTGLLKGAMRDLLQDSLVRKPAFNPTALMKDDAMFQSRFGELATRLDALYALAGETIRLFDACDREGRDLTPLEEARVCSANALIHHDGTQLMDQIIMLSGSTSIYMANRQQRRWRDLRCAAQHQSANIGQYAGYAKGLIADAGAADKRR